MEAQEEREGVTDGGHDGKPEELARGEAEEPAGSGDGKERLGEIEKEYGEAEWPATDAEGVGGPWVVIRPRLWDGRRRAAQGCGRADVPHDPVGGLLRTSR